MNKIIISAILLLLVQIGLTLGMYLQKKEYTAYSPDAPFLTFELNSVDQLTIFDGQGNKTRLHLKNNQWVLPDYFNAKADNQQISAVLEKIHAAKQGLAVATTADGLARFRVAENSFERQIILHSQGKKVGEFYLGTSAGLRKSHARTEDGQEVITVDLSALEFDAAPESWLDKNLLGINIDSLTSIHLPDGTLVKEGEQWLIQQKDSTQPGNQEAIERLLDTLANMSLEGILPTKEAQSLTAIKPKFSYTLTKADATIQEYKLYQGEQKEYYGVQVSGDNHLYKVANWQLDDMVSATFNQYTQNNSPDQKQPDQEKQQ